MKLKKVKEDQVYGLYNETLREQLRNNLKKEISVYDNQFDFYAQEVNNGNYLFS